MQWVSMRANEWISMLASKLVSQLANVMLTALRSSTPSLASCSSVTNLVVNNPRLFSCRLGVAGCIDSPIAPDSFRPESKSIQQPCLCLLLVRLSKTTILAPKPSASRYRPENIPKHEAKTRVFERLNPPVWIGSGIGSFRNQQVPEKRFNNNQRTHTFTLKRTPAVRWYLNWLKPLDEQCIMGYIS